MSLIERLEKRELYFRHAVEGEYDAVLRKARFELEANAAEIGRLREALKEARIVLMAHGFGAHSVTISQIDAALNKQESGNV